MQAQHITIIIVGMAFGFGALTYYIHRALTRATAKGYNLGYEQAHNSRRNQIAALNQDLADTLKKHQDDRATLAQLQQGLTEMDARAQQIAQQLKTTTFTQADHSTLCRVIQTLDLAIRTWNTMPGTDPVKARTRQQVQQITLLAARVLETIESAQTAINSQPNDLGQGAQPGAAA
ncbi:hypothetical protein QNM99_19800 [Pseudomonas sp. PCH446]